MVKTKWYSPEWSKSAKLLGARLKNSQNLRDVETAGLIHPDWRASFAGDQMIVAVFNDSDSPTEVAEKIQSTLLANGITVSIYRIISGVA